MRIMSYHVLPLHRPTAQARRCNKEAWHFPSSLAGKKHICQLVKVCSTAFLHADCLPAGFDVFFFDLFDRNLHTRRFQHLLIHGLSDANLPTHGVLRCSLEIEVFSRGATRVFRSDLWIWHPLASDLAIGRTC
jgi:hypothetical protein